MPTLRNTSTGVVITVSEETARNLSGYESAGGGDAAEPVTLDEEEAGAVHEPAPQPEPIATPVFEQAPEPVDSAGREVPAAPTAEQPTAAAAEPAAEEPVEEPPAEKPAARRRAAADE